MARTLNCHGQRALMAGAGAGNPAGKNLAPLGNEPAQFGNVFVVDELGAVHAEAANLV